MKKIHRFITSYEIINQEIEIKDISLIHQWKNVLKFKKGERLILANQEQEILGEIKELSKTSCLLNIIEEHKNTNKINKKVNLFLSILKKENFEFAIQKATEIGINSITPIISERTIKTGLNFERLEKIVKEASELSGRNTIPKINKTINFKEIFEITEGQKTILFDIEGQDVKETKDQEINIIIGPEGGFTEKELIIAKEKGTLITSISPLTLRAETAAIIASYATLN